MLLQAKMTNDKSRNMQVVLRVRPLSRREMEQNQRSIIRVADPNTIIFDPDEDEDEFFFHGAKQTHRDITKRVSKNLTMSFDQVFDNQSHNSDVFEYSMRPLVQSVMKGYNCSAFVYGATGAGKTFTMLGSADNPGVTYLTMKELFEQIDLHSGERKFDIGISYLEVYNEQVMNLLTKTGPLKLREDSNGVVVGGLVLKPIFAADELLDLLALGNRNRTQHPTDANAESSRSHAIFQVHIRMTNKASGEKRMVKLSMIDLAGSERGSSTKCEGQRFKEGASINKSLLALGNCINKLADGSKHIPYRDSNMTRILKDSLGGNCKTVMIANVSPSSLTFEDTYNTLKYAGRYDRLLRPRRPRNETCLFFSGFYSFSINGFFFTGRKKFAPQPSPRTYSNQTCPKSTMCASSPTHPPRWTASKPSSRDWRLNWSRSTKATAPPNRAKPLAWPHYWPIRNRGKGKLTKYTPICVLPAKTSSRCRAKRNY